VFLWSWSDADKPGPVAAPAVASNEPDDYLWKSPGSGLEFIAEHHVAAEGVQVALAGEWRDDQRNIVFRLREGGTYELENYGSVAYVNRNSGAYDHADGVSTGERGTWAFDPGTLTLTLTPASAQIHAVSGMHDRGTSDEKADAPRQWNVSGVTIEYTPHDSPTTKTRPGLHIRGPSPAWYYPNVPWDLVLRSAPFSK
jgi:hypothetical protein